MTARLRHVAQRAGGTAMLNKPTSFESARNCILKGLPLLDLQAIAPFLQPIALDERVVLQELNKPIEYVSFIESGIVSLTAFAAGTTLETARVDNRGAVGASVALCNERSICRATVLVRGRALRIHIDDLQRLMRERLQIRDDLLRYMQSLMIHSSQTALCGVRHGSEQRLASWLCMVCDALDDNVVPITHDHMSAILGLRRAGITEALARFEEQGIVRKTRGELQVRDRKLLQQKACSCYGVIANAYDRPPSEVSNVLRLR